ncbi:RagB/SusD family nutrient uptake outer membrane protein [Flavobacterium silvaticum]|uniref:RagB/SusD family nutrient uptake outer membrane protein n=1 Tax=Flavobacterium silvaticum TaxID=1852020 RepID=A0A972FP84_9FLAO|nr:RagB/SusD family nutrient uptake outer membrane protein [Flavobacterium silvaticum]NMH26899.1 RagB/SusD family nutrient uptake outer membrane protein [Flavobacterium silvaticum]
MKKYITIGLLIGIIGLSGCEDDLNQEPIGVLTQEQVDLTPTLTGMENQTKSAYMLLSNTLNIMGSWDWTGGLVFQNDIVLQDIGSDDMQKKWIIDGDQTWMDEINSFTFTTTNGGPNGLWRYNYEGIKRANTVIQHCNNPQIESITGITTERKNQLLAECLFLRSYYYFALVTNFGGVPLILEPVTDINTAFELAARTDEATIFDQLRSDLDQAASLLPNTKYSSSTEQWRVSKGAAIALHAKIELYSENWTAVPGLVDQLSGLGFGLNANYFDAFRQSSEFNENEDIFVFDHQNNAAPLRGNGLCAVMGWGFFAPTQNFLDEFEENDPRKFYTVDVPNQNVNKLLGSLDGTFKGNDDAPVNKIYIRYADCLLWKAEALLNSGDTAGAVTIINQVRNRARTTVAADGSTPPAGTLPDRSSAADANQVRQWLIHERRVELGFESQRLLDLKRWGIAQQVLDGQGINFQEKHMLYPIPQSDVNATAGTLTQNPGY